ncbi:uncharacterized protein LOC141495289 [Macrotis lagotis]|uniref:uncharacterized protein LOC141495289 n=1 Tax=Macrotis lagotis TaxID=92651 RepID=UPI003D68C4CD
MGSKLSKEQVFIRDLKLALKDRGVKVKKKDLVRFFLFIDEVCPWFLVTGPEIHPGKWQKVGRDLNQKLKIEGPDAVPVSALSYWGLIRDIVESATGDPTKQQLLSVVESCLRPLSRTASIKSLKEEEAKPPKTPARSPSAAIEIPPSKSLYPPLPSELTPAEEPITCPVFTRNKNLRSSPETDPDSEPLDPGDEAELEEEAARYNNPDWPLASAPPPYLTAPAFLPLGPNMTTLNKAREQLSVQVKELREVLDLQTQYAHLSSELSALQDSLQRSLKIPLLKNQFNSKTRSESKTKQRHSKAGAATNYKKQMAFPVMTRSRQDDSDPDAGEAEPPESSHSEGEEEEENRNREDEREVADSLGEQKSLNYRKIHFKSLKDLHTAVKTYGPNAPFTLSALEAISRGGYLLPSEWLRVVQAVLTRGQFLTWKADFFDHCQTIASTTYKTSKGAYEKLTGQGKYASETRQSHLPIGLLAQAASAPISAWRALPNTGFPFAPLNKIVQGNQEEFSEYVSRLLEATERTLGQEATDDQLVRRLAYENANPTCRSILRGKWRDKTLDEMIRLCRDIDPLTQAVHLAVGAALQHSDQSKTCFRCGQEGHFAHQCPITNTNTGGFYQRPNQPQTLCPRCRKGKHWANTCRSTTNAEGQPIVPFPGNGKRGQPRAPQTTPNPQASGNSLPTYHYTEPPQGAQGWTCAPPPVQY